MSKNTKSTHITDEAERVLSKFRTRWMRWLGNKTRVNRFEYTDLLGSEWSGWASSTLMKHGVQIKGLNWRKDSDPLSIRQYFAKAIRVADMDDLRKLDGKYCLDKIEKRYK